MAILDNARHEKFVQNLIKGMSQRKAYREAFPNSGHWKDTTVDVKASTLFSDDKVLVRYKELQAIAQDASIMNRKERMVALSEIAKDEEEKADARIKAIDTLNKMDGDYVNKVEVSGELKRNNPYADLTTEELRKLIHDG